MEETENLTSAHILTRTHNTHHRGVHFHLLQTYSPSVYHTTILSWYTSRQSTGTGRMDSLKTAYNSIYQSEDAFYTRNNFCWNFSNWDWMQNTLNNLPQSSSSVPSGQCCFPSHRCQPIIHIPIEHWYWSSVQSETHNTSANPNPNPNPFLSSRIRPKRTQNCAHFHNFSIHISFNANNWNKLTRKQLCTKQFLLYIFIIWKLNSGAKRFLQKVNTLLT